MATGSTTLLLTKASGQVISLLQAQDVESAFMETRDFAPSGDDIYSFIDTIIPKFKNRVGATGLTLTIKFKNRLNDPPQVFGTFALDANDEPIFPQGLPSAVYYRIRIEDTLLTKRWLFFGLEAFGEADGKYF